MRKSILFMALLVLSVLLSALLMRFFSGGASMAREPMVWDLREKVQLPLRRALPDIAAPGLVYVGEAHDSKEDHGAQLAVIHALRREGADVVVGLEMIDHAHQPFLDDWVAGQLPERRMQEIFMQDWGFPWSLYRPIFVYCKDHRVPMVALNVPREITRKVAREGFAALDREDLGQLPPISCDLHPDYEAFLRRALGGHGQGQTFTRFCEAQLVWDTAMAIYALEYLEQVPGVTLVALCGTVHAWKLAIPSQVARLTPEEVRQRVLLPYVPDRLTPELLDTQDADYLLYP